LVQDVCAGIKSIMRFYLESQETHRKEALSDTSPKGIASQFDSKLSAKQRSDRKDVPVVINDERSEHLVSSLERCFLYGLKTKQAKVGSFWEMILMLAETIEQEYGIGGRYSTFFSDVKFADSLVLNNDRDMTSRGRAWLRYVLMCSRMSETLKLVDHMKKLYLEPTAPPLMVLMYEPYAVWASEEHTEILVTALRQLLPLRFNLKLHQAVPYRWRRVDGFFSKVYPPRYYEKNINKLADGENLRPGNPFAAVKGVRRRRRQKKKTKKGKRRHHMGARMNLEKAGVGMRPPEGFPWEENVKRQGDRIAIHCTEEENPLLAAEGWVNESEFGMTSKPIATSSVPSASVDYKHRSSLRAERKREVAMKSSFDPFATGNLANFANNFANGFKTTGSAGNREGIPSDLIWDEGEEQPEIPEFAHFPKAEASDDCSSVSSKKKRVVKELLSDSERKEAVDKKERRVQRRQRREKQRIRKMLKEALEEQQNKAAEEENEYERQLKDLRDQLRKSQDQMAQLREELESRSQSESEASYNSGKTNGGVPWRVVAGSRVPVRTAPSFVSPVIGYVDPGYDINVTETEGNWVRHGQGWTNSRAADGAAQLMCLSLERSEDTDESANDLDELIQDTVLTDSAAANQSQKATDGFAGLEGKRKRLKLTVRYMIQEVVLRPGTTVIDVVIPHSTTLRPLDEILYIDGQPVSGPLSLKAAISMVDPPFTVIVNRPEIPYQLLQMEHKAKNEGREDSNEGMADGRDNAEGVPEAEDGSPSNPVDAGNAVEEKSKAEEEAIANTEREGGVEGEGSLEGSEANVEEEQRKRGEDKKTEHRSGWVKTMHQVVPWDKKALMRVPQAPAGAMETGEDTIVPGFFFLWKQYEKRGVAQMVEEQGGKCPECDAEIQLSENRLFATYQGNFCFYTGFFMCPKCCSGKRKAVIPSYLIFRGDPEPKVVSNVAYAFLTSVHKLPLINITKKNRKLTLVHRSFRLLLALHQRLKHMKPFVDTCPQRAMLQGWLNECYPKQKYDISHMLEPTPVYSFYDLVQCIADGNRAVMEVTQKLVNHITDRNCQACLSKGFYCDYDDCKLNGVIGFKFQVEKVVSCPVCNAMYHRPCFHPSTCPQCARLARPQQGQST